MAREKARHGIELTKNQITFIAAISIVIIVVAYAYFYIPRPIYDYEYRGAPLKFRADLREANKVPVYPNDAVLYYEIRGGIPRNLTIVFMPVEGENSIYSAEGFEISYKLGLMNKILGKELAIDAKNISSYQHLPGKIQHPIVALVHPRFANETAVRLDGHVIYISGLPSNDPANPYKNLDLATVKFLMVILGIELNE